MSIDALLDSQQKALNAQIDEQIKDPSKRSAARAQVNRHFGGLRATCQALSSDPRYSQDDIRRRALDSSAKIEREVKPFFERSAAQATATAEKKDRLSGLKHRVTAAKSAVAAYPKPSPAAAPTIGKASPQRIPPHVKVLPSITITLDVTETNTIEELSQFPIGHAMAGLEPRPHVEVLHIIQGAGIECVMDFAHVVALPIHAAGYLIKEAIANLRERSPLVDAVTKGAGKAARATVALVKKEAPESIKQFVRKWREGRRLLPERIERKYGIPQAKTQTCIEDTEAIVSTAAFYGAGRALGALKKSLFASDGITVIEGSYRIIEPAQPFTASTQAAAEIAVVAEAAIKRTAQLAVTGTTSTAISCAPAQAAMQTVSIRNAVMINIVANKAAHPTAAYRAFDRAAQSLVVSTVSTTISSVPKTAEPTQPIASVATTGNSAILDLTAYRAAHTTAALKRAGLVNTASTVRPFAPARPVMTRTAPPHCYADSDILIPPEVPTIFPDTSSYYAQWKQSLEETIGLRPKPLTTKGLYQRLAPNALPKWNDVKSSTYKVITETILYHRVIAELKMACVLHNDGKTLRVFTLSFDLDNHKALSEAFKKRFLLRTLAVIRDIAATEFGVSQVIIQWPSIDYTFLDINHLLHHYRFYVGEHPAFSHSPLVTQVRNRILTFLEGDPHYYATIAYDLSPSTPPQTQRLFTEEILDHSLTGSAVAIDEVDQSSLNVPKGTFREISISDQWNQSLEETISLRPKPLTTKGLYQRLAPDALPKWSDVKSNTYEVITETILYHRVIAELKIACVVHNDGKTLRVFKLSFDLDNHKALSEAFKKRFLLKTLAVIRDIAATEFGVSQVIIQWPSVDHTFLDIDHLLHHYRFYVGEHPAFSHSPLVTQVRNRILTFLEGDPHYYPTIAYDLRPSTPPQTQRLFTEEIRDHSLTDSAVAIDEVAQSSLNVPKGTFREISISELLEETKTSKLETILLFQGVNDPMGSFTMYPIDKKIKKAFKDYNIVFIPDITSADQIIRVAQLYENIVLLIARAHGTPEYMRFGPDITRARDFQGMPLENFVEGAQVVLHSCDVGGATDNGSLNFAQKSQLIFGKKITVIASSGEVIGKRTVIKGNHFLLSTWERETTLRMNRRDNSPAYRQLEDEKPIVNTSGFTGFMDLPDEFNDVLSKDMIVVHFHNKRQQTFWFTTLKNSQSMLRLLRNGLPIPQGINCSHVSVTRIPAGTIVKYMEGSAFVRNQQSGRDFLLKDQMFFWDFDKKWPTVTRTLPLSPATGYGEFDARAQAIQRGEPYPDPLSLTLTPEEIAYKKAKPRFFKSRINHQSEGFVPASNVLELFTDGAKADIPSIALSPARNLTTSETRVYFQDTYFGELSAKVVETGEDLIGTFVVFDRTLFHPQGGGQPSDKGYFELGSEKIPVTQLTLDGSVIKHYYTSQRILDIAAGHNATLTLDMQSRVLFARLHSAGHLIANAVRELYPQMSGSKGNHFPGGQAAVGCVLKPGETLPDLAEVKARLTDKLQELVSRSIPLNNSFETAQRTVQFEGYPAYPCGGTHVRHSGEIGTITIRSVKKEKDGFKIGYDLL